MDIEQGGALPDLEELFPHYHLLPEDEAIIPYLGRLLIHTKYHLDRGEISKLEIDAPTQSSYTRVKIYVLGGLGWLASGVSATELVQSWSKGLVEVDTLLEKQKTQARCPGNVFIRDCAYNTCMVCRKEPMVEIPF